MLYRLKSSFALIIFLALYPLFVFSEEPWSESRVVSTSEGDIHFRLAGKGEPLLLLHGFFGYGGQWEKYIDDFDGAYQIIAPDLPGHGGSTTNLEQFDVKTAAVMIWAVIDDLGYTKIRGIGYSAGGMTLLQMALLQPDRMSAMVLAASAHLNPDRQSAMTYEMLPEDFRQDLLRNHREDEKKIRALLAMSYHSEITTKSLSALQVPTLLLSGDRDESFALYKVISTYEALPNAQLWIEPGLGHSLFWTEWGGDAALEKALPLRATEFFKR